jgi:hypothetical protein
MKKQMMGWVGLMAVAAWAGDIEPWMLERAELLFAEEFKASGLDTNRWSAAKGEWSLENGSLKGAELAADQHAGVVRCDTPMRDMIVQFDFRFDGGKTFSLSLNDPSGHNSRVVVTPTDFIARKDLDKKDFRSFSAVLGECAADLATGRHTMLVEYCGPEMLARLDDQTFVLGSHPGIDVERNTLGFTVSGDGVFFDNIKVWKGVPLPTWAGRRGALIRRQADRAAVARDPQDAWTIQEAIVRGQLMASDPGFVALVEQRAAIQDQLKKSYPKTLRKGAPGAAERKRLTAEDPAYKELTRSLTLARKAERDYQFRQSPELKNAYEAYLAAR